MKQSVIVPIGFERLSYYLERGDVVQVIRNKTTLRPTRAASSALVWCGTVRYGTVRGTQRVRVCGATISGRLAATTTGSDSSTRRPWWRLGWGLLA
eukprot:scaffold379422_cov21-Prasinocladus_malaysianus.AAC.1